MEINFLSPADLTTNHITKSFTQENGQIRQTSDYNAGFLFNFISETISDSLPARDRMKDITKLFLRYRGTHFRIYGRPVADLLPPCQRLKKYFPPDKDGYTFLHIDIDNWDIPEDIRSLSKFDLTPNTTAAMIRMLLDRNKLEWLSETDLIILLSASQFTPEKLNAHIYFQTEAPITLRDMRFISLSFNKAIGHKVFDHQAYKSVQPDFISSPNCTNFKDPIPDRIFFSPGLSDRPVATKDIMKFKRQLPTLTNTATGYGRDPDSLGDGWQEVLENHAGTEARGINEPCYRAAALMVKEFGTRAVMANVEYYASALYNAAWEAIVRRGVRGGDKDQDRYNLQKFRSYVSSAAQKDIGHEVDKLDDAVRTEIDLAAVTGDVKGLTSLHCLGCASRLKHEYPRTFILLKAYYRANIRRVLSFSEWNKLINATFCKPATTREELLQLLPGGQIMPINPLKEKPLQISVGDAGNQLSKEKDLIAQIADQYDLILTPKGSRYVGRIETETDGVALYHIRSIDSKLASMIQTTVALNVKQGMTSKFGLNFISYLNGLFELKGSANSKPISKRTVERRVHYEPSGDSPVLWYNLGRKKGKEPECLRIDHRGVTKTTHSDPACPVLWEPDVPVVNVDMKEPEKSIKFLANRLPYYIRTDTKGICGLASWMMSSLTRYPMPYILELTGSAASGKTTAATFLKDIVDTNGFHLSSPQSEDRVSIPNGGISNDFLTALSETYVTVIDNVSKISAPDQDRLCNVVTGMNYKNRILFTSIIKETHIKRPLIITGITESITRPDLIERTINVELDVIQSWVKDLFFSWDMDVPKFRMGMFQLLSQLFATIGGFSENFNDVKPRVMIESVIIKILTNSEDRLSDIAEVAAKEKSAASGYIDNWARQFSAFLNDTPMDRQKQLTSSRLHSMYARWIQENYGKEKYINKSRYPSDVCVVSPEYASKNVAQFGRFLKRSKTVVEELSSWRFKKSRKALGIFYVFSKHFSLTDLI